jgi:hypothetical protein
MTKQDLETIKNRCKATTIAPWIASIEGRDHESGSHFIMTGIPKGENIWQEKRGEDLEIIGATIADLDFIANARQDIPALIEEIERLKSVLEQKNKLGIPINNDGVFEKCLLRTIEVENTKITYEIKEWEVLFAQVDVTNLNVTQIFNWGIRFEQMKNNN